MVRPELADQLEGDHERRARQAPSGFRDRRPRARGRRRADPRLRARAARAGRGRRGDRTLPRPPSHRLAARRGHGARGRRDRHRLHSRSGDRARPRAGPGEPRGGGRRLGRVPRRPAHARLGAGRRGRGDRRGRRLGDPPDRDRGPAAHGLADRDDRSGPDGPARRSRRRADRRGRARGRGPDGDRAGRRHAGRRVPPIRRCRGAPAARVPATAAGCRGDAATWPAADRRTGDRRARHRGRVRGVLRRRRRDRAGGGGQRLQRARRAVRPAARRGGAAGDAQLDVGAAARVVRCAPGAVDRRAARGWDPRAAVRHALRRPAGQRADTNVLLQRRGHHPDGRAGRREPAEHRRRAAPPRAARLPR